MDANMMVGFISQVGFPIAVAAFSLLRLEKTIQANTKVVSDVSAALLLLQSKEGKLNE